MRQQREHSQSVLQLVCEKAEPYGFNACGLLPTSPCNQEAKAGNLLTWQKVKKEKKGNKGKMLLTKTILFLYNIR
jgi:hypothetical protein